MSLPNSYDYDKLRTIRIHGSQTTSIHGNDKPKPHPATKFLHEAYEGEDGNAWKIEEGIIFVRDRDLIDHPEHPPQATWKPVIPKKHVDEVVVYDFFGNELERRSFGLIVDERITGPAWWLLTIVGILIVLLTEGGW